jgi:MerR family redox-sensitive transcriptional activator SoxR
MARELTVGEVAARSGVAVSALHFYERKGLIRSHRTRGNQRRYDRDVLRRVSLIQFAQELGISLAEVGSSLSGLPEGRPPSRGDWERISKKWAVDLDRRIASLQVLRQKLTGCIGCGCLSIDRCAIFNAEDHLAARGTGPVLLRVEKRKSATRTGSS